MDCSGGATSGSRSPRLSSPSSNCSSLAVRDLVRRDELVSVYEATGGSPNPIAVKAMLGRVVKRFAEVGLVLQSVRGRGYLLDATNPCPLHAAQARADDLAAGG